VYRLPHRVQDVVGARGGGVRGFEEGTGYLVGGEGGIVLITREAEERGRWGLGGEDVVKEHYRYFSRIRRPGKFGNL